MIAAFEKGIRFQCTRCGECCRSLRSDLPLSPRDVSRISRHLGLSIGRFVRRYGRHVRETIAYPGGVLEAPQIFLRVPPSGRCTFLRGNECVLQSVKPEVCARSPLVGYVAEDRSAWKRAKEMCPGIGRGPWYSRRAIMRILNHERAEEEREARQLRRHGWNLGRMLRAALPSPTRRRLTLTSRDLEGSS